MKGGFGQVLAGLALLAVGLAVGYELGSRRSREEVAASPVPPERSAALPPRSERSPAPRRDRREPTPTPRRESPPAPRGAEAIAKPWIEQALQIGDVAARDGALGQIREAMGSGDRTESYAALLAFNALHEREFDRAGFRPVIEPHLHAASPQVRTAAWYALHRADPRPEDLALLRQEAQDPGMRDRLPHLLMIWEDGDLTGESGDVIAGLLEGGGSGTSPREVLRGIWGARLSEDLEAHVIDLARGDDREAREDAIYYALSTQGNKSRAAVECLLEIATDPAPNRSAGRAAWGLNSGVPEEMREEVAAVGLDMVRAGVSGYLGEQAHRWLKSYATPEQREELEALLAQPGIDAKTREAFGP